MSYYGLLCTLTLQVWLETLIKRTIQPDPEGINYIKNVLLPTAELMERKALEKLSSRGYCLDQDTSISTFKQLVEIVGANPICDRVLGYMVYPLQISIAIS